MTTRLTVSSLAMPITIKANTTFSAPLAVNAIGPFVIALGTTSKGALATVNLKSIGDVAAAKTTLILPATAQIIFLKLLVVLSLSPLQQQIQRRTKSPPQLSHHWI